MNGTTGTGTAITAEAPYGWLATAGDHVFGDAGADYADYYRWVCAGVGDVLLACAQDTEETALQVATRAAEYADQIDDPIVERLVREAAADVLAALKGAQKDGPATRDVLVVAAVLSGLAGVRALQVSELFADSNAYDIVERAEEIAPSHIRGAEILRNARVIRAELAEMAGVETRHPFVRHTRETLDRFLAEGRPFAGSHCAAHGCGRPSWDASRHTDAQPLVPKRVSQ